MFNDSKNHSIGLSVALVGGLAGCLIGACAALLFSSKKAGERKNEEAPHSVNHSEKEPNGILKSPSKRQASSKPSSKSRSRQSLHTAPVQNLNGETTGLETFPEEVVKGKRPSRSKKTSRSQDALIEKVSQSENIKSE
ncbi:MAG: hypothetical protein ACH350_02015 [Parachlamydiaceae bacterium]